jgi:ATP-dependent Lhr-like helicase
MSAFNRLHPAIQHHVVNSLGWRELRPVQDLAIDACLDGANLVVLAPTAGGKTEAAFLPVLSQMLTGSWAGLGALYVSPIRALLNNQEERLARYFRLVGRRAACWHGDTPQSEKRRAVVDPPDCLLTTPESLEAILISTKIDHRQFFTSVRAVVIDELHAFAGDDRGWHLLAVLSRIQRIAGRDIQRIGLSATVGTPSAMLEWLSSGSARPRRVVQPPADLQPAPTPAPGPEVVLDYVGGLDNAAQVIAALHRGEKRLVFCDSRSRVEHLAANLRARGVTTLVAHSSLGRDERRQAERAFVEGRDCAIVATSALELGIDVGDLDRVIQVDAPATVSSFLQRMGRTGRRPGTVRNCLFLATSDEGLLRAAGLIALWRSGFIEPSVPPPAPMHILAQQLMALALQERGIGRSEWFGWVGSVPAFHDLDRGVVDRIVAGMIERRALWDDAGVLWLGREGQDTYGRKNFLELVSVFTAPPLFAVLHGRRELGSVDQSTFLARRDDGPTVLLLAGRAWRVAHLDWGRRRAFVEPAVDGGRSRWRGQGQFLNHELCRAIRRLLIDDAAPPAWSRRAVSRMASVRSDFPWLAGDDANVLHASSGQAVWWTFAGGQANAALAHELARRLGGYVTSDSFAVRFPTHLATNAADRSIHDLRSAAPAHLVPPVSEQALEGLKFSGCLPQDLANLVVEARLSAPRAIEETLARTTRTDIMD